MVTERRSGPRLRSLAAIALAVPAVSVAVLGMAFKSPDLTGDVAFYYDVSGRVLAGEVPYVDFDFEYPPLSVVPMMLPRLFNLDAAPDQGAYEVAFLAISASLAALMTLSLAMLALRYGGSLVHVVAATVAGTAVTAHLAAWRYDLFPALILLMGVALLMTNRSAAAGIATGLGIGVKLFPGVLLPIGVAWLLAHGRRREAIAFAAVAISVSAAPIVALAILDAEAPLQFVAFQMARGYQLESVMGGLLELGSVLGLTPVGVEFAFKTYQVTSPITGWLMPLQLMVAIAVQLVLAVALWLHVRRRRDHDDRLCLSAYVLAATIAFLVTNKVLSPQHLLWLLPLVPLASGAVVTTLYVLAGLVGMLIFPSMYPQLIGLDPTVVTVLNARNALLVIALIWVVRGHWPGDGILARSRTISWARP